MKTFLKIALLMTALLTPAGPARASLTALVTPGYQFPVDGSISPTYPLLNALALPTITITGTVGGSNTLSPGSVTGTSLAANVLTTGGGLVFDGNNPPGIEIGTQGVVTNMFGTNDWLWPLAQPSLASPLQLNYDPVEFRGTTNDNGLNLNYDPQYFTTNAAVANWTNWDGKLRTNTTGLTLRFGTNTLAVATTNGVTEPVYLQPNFGEQWQTNVVGGVTNIGWTLVQLQNLQNEQTYYWTIPANNVSVTSTGTNYAMFTITNAHNLGAVPNFVAAYVQRTGTNADATGYTNNALLPLGQVTDSYSGGFNGTPSPFYQLWADSINVYLRVTVPGLYGQNGVNLTTQIWQTPSCVNSNIVVQYNGGILAVPQQSTAITLINTNWNRLVIAVRP
jgi:hypothetical protein